jgi:hypothetical protein
MAECILRPPVHPRGAERREGGRPGARVNSGATRQLAASDIIQISTLSGVSCVFPAFQTKVQLREASFLSLVCSDCFCQGLLKKRSPVVLPFSVELLQYIF